MNSVSFTHHDLLWSDFDLIARSRGDRALMSKLRTVDQSRRLLLLRGLLDRVVKVPQLDDFLTPVDEVWDLLVRAQRSDLKAVERILAHPYTGSWAGYILRLLEQGRSGECPLWMHFGYLHTLAAAAALQAHIDFVLKVPVWRGNMVLPTWGCAQLPGESEFATAELAHEESSLVITGSQSVISLPVPIPSSAPGWRGLRRFQFRTRDRDLGIVLDDVDPHRGLYYPIPPRPLDESSADSWSNLLEDAWSLIVEHLPEFADSLPMGLTTIVPDVATPFRLLSGSTGEAFGSAMIGEPDDPAVLAAALVHEFQHNRLGALLQMVRLHDDDRTERIYTPWREDPRPLGGAVHGIYAFFGIAAFWRAITAAQPDNRAAAFEYAHWREQLWQTLMAIREDEALTEAGRRFLNGVANQADGWRSESVHPDSERWAAKLAVDHYTGWRLRYFRPSLATIERLALAWRAGEPCPDFEADLSFGAEADGEWPNARADLIRLHLADDTGTRIMRMWSEVPGAIEADALFVTGQNDAASIAYQDWLGGHPDDASALIGLGLALEESDPAASRAFIEESQMVRAVHRRVREGGHPCVVEIARWIGRQLDCTA